MLTTDEETNSQIQWQRSKNVPKPSWIEQHWIELCLGLTVAGSVLCEYLWSYGASVLIVCLFMTLVFGVSPRRHDSIPAASMFYPIVGHFPWIRTHFEHLYDQHVKEIMDLTKKNNGIPVPCFSIRLGGRRIIVLCDPTVIDIVWRRQFGNAVKDETQYDNIRELLGNGIFASNGAIWKKHRAIASRMFTTRSLRDFMFENFMETADRLVIKCGELMQVNDNKTNGIDIYDMFLRLTFEAFTNTAFGIHLDAIGVAPKVIPFANAFDKSLYFFALRFAQLPFVWKLQRKLDIGNEKTLRKHCQLMDAFIADVVSKRKEYFATLTDIENSDQTKDKREGIDMENEAKSQSPSETESAAETGAKNGSKKKYRKELRKRYDLLSLFIKDDPNISDKELRDITLNFIIAGRDTTAQALSWFTYEMTKTDENGNKVNGAIADKIRQEIATVLERNGETGVGDSLSYQTANQLTYLEAALLETLRLYPSVPVMSRTAVAEYNLGEITGDYERYNYTIHKGDGVFVAAWAMARLPWVWDDPLTFKPERFIDSKTGKIIDHSGSRYPAFNLNPRMCLGKNLALLEAKIAIVKLWTKFKHIEIVPNQTVTYIMSATNHLKYGLKVTLREEKQ